MTSEKKSDESNLVVDDSILSPPAQKQTLWSSFKDSFKPAIETDHTLKTNYDPVDVEKLTDLEKINLNSANSSLRREIGRAHV